MPGVSELARQEEENLVTGESSYVVWAVVSVKANSPEEAQQKADNLANDHPWLDVTDQVMLEEEE